MNRLGTFYAPLWALGFLLLLSAPLIAQTKQRVSKEVGEAIRLETEALSLEKQGRILDAEQLYKKSLAIVERELPRDPILAGSFNNFGNFYNRQKRFADAEPLLARAVQMYIGAHGEIHPATVTATNNLGTAYLGLGRLDEAEALYKRALAGAEALEGPNHSVVAFELTYLAEVKFRKGAYVEAEEYLRRSMSILEKALGAEAPHVGAVMHRLAWALKAQRKDKEATELFDRANQIANKNKQVR